MAIAQPQSNDTLNSPDHAALHRIIAADTTAPAQSLTIDSVGDLGGISTKNLNPTNLLFNGDFELWSAGTSAAPDGWALSGTGATIARETTTIKLGTYSAKLTRVGTDCNIQKTVHTARGINYWKSRTITYSCWVYATVSNITRISLGDGVTETYSSYHTGGGAWELLTVTKTLSASATGVYAINYVITADTTSYFDGAMCVEGASQFAFSDKPAEEGIWADYSTQSTVVGWASFTTKKIYTKKIGKTVFVAFDIRGTSNATTVTFTLPYTSAMTFPTRACAFTTDNDINTTTGGLIDLATGASLVNLFKDMAGAAWTALGSKFAVGQFWYEVA